MDDSNFKIRAIYKDLARDLEMKLAHLQFKVEVQEIKLGQLQQVLHGKEADSVWQRDQFVKMLQKKDDDLSQQREQFEKLLQAKDDDLGQQREQFEKLLQNKADDLVEQRDQYEVRLAESRSDRADAIANEKQNTLVLQHHLLHIPRLITPALKGKKNSPGTDETLINLFPRIREPSSDMARGQIGTRILYTKTPLQSRHRGRHANTHHSRGQHNYGQKLQG